MSLSTQYSTGTYTRRIAVIKSQSIVEIKFSDSDAGEVSAVCPQVSLTSCEVSSGRVSYGGRLVCTLVCSDGGDLCRIQKGAEFTHYCDDDRLAPAHIGQCTLTCERTQIKREGSSYVVAVVVGAEISVYASAERNMLTSAEGAIVRRENAKLYSVVTFSGESEVEDEFDCNAEDVLMPSAKALVTDCACSSGVVKIDGELYLSLLALRGGKPVALDRVIPFKAEVACDGALLERYAVCRADIKEISVNASVNEEKGKCSLDLVARLGFEGWYCEEEEVSLIADAFSPDCNLKLTYGEENMSPCTGIKAYTEKVTGLCAVKAKLDYTCAFLAVALPKAEFARSGDGIEGSVSATLLYEQNGDLRSTEINLPFTTRLSGLNGDAQITVAVCGVNLRQRAEGECEAEAVLKIACAECEEGSVRYLTQVEEGEKTQVNPSAISVYIPSAGDDLWATAKKLRQSPDEISSTNPDLSFPLSGKERILVYRPKTV